MERGLGTGRIAAVAAILAMVAVLAGAFGAHALEGDARAVRLLETGSRYQLAHAVAAIAVMAVLPWARLAVAVMLVGAVLFPGSLYALALGAPGPVAALAPIGGIAFVVAWGLVALAAVSGPRPPRGSD